MHKDIEYMKKNLLVFMFFLIMLGDFAFAKITVVKYLKTSEDAIRYQYHYDLIHEVLEKTKETFGPYKIQPFEVQMTSKRVNIEAVKGKLINLHWSDVGHPELDKGMLPIPIPLLKGIHGNRIFLIRKEDQPKFSKITTLEELKKFKLGQGNNWGDNKIYEYNKIRVIKGIVYSGLFGMLSKGRFDYFPRSILEAPIEYEVIKDKYPNLHVEKTILLVYPFPVFFYVSKNAPELASRMLAGLESMIKDGSFDKLFFKYHQQIIDKAKIKGRKIFKIKNPFLPDTVPFHRKELWLDILNYKK